MATPAKVRTGRECRDCGEDRLEAMTKDRSRPDGHMTLCKRCGARRTRERTGGRRELGPIDERRAEAGKLRALGFKRCATGHTAPLQEFLAHRSRFDGLANHCRECHRTYIAATRAKMTGRSSDELAEAARLAHPDGTKRCRRGHVVPIRGFRRDAYEADGLRRTCAACEGRRTRKYTEDHWRREGIPDRCVYCHADEPSHIDHVVALSRGGADELSNLLPACADCNKSKGAKPLGQWLRSRRLVPYSDLLTETLRGLE